MIQSTRPSQKIHFLGIGGSGMSGVACLAKQAGYEVTGCDAQAETAYSEKLQKFDIPVSVGHSVDHLVNTDYLVVTPAALFKSSLDKEVLMAKEQNILLTWQEFLGKHLQVSKEVVCLSGTHGKSTTTAMASLVFELAGKDPSVMIGATIKEWNANFRVGKGEIFITESDEFYDNFLHYSPSVIVLNNIEFDHPDFFTSEDQLFTSFKHHILNLTGKKVLIVNQDAPGIKKLLDGFTAKELGGINLIGYTLGKKVLDTPISLQGEIVERGNSLTTFKTSSKSWDIGGQFSLKVAGDYNVENALGVIALSKLYGLDFTKVREALERFEGIGRRLELLGEGKGVKVYDDYAHHPTAVAKTLTALSQKYPGKKIFAIVEPHSYSRTKALLAFYKDAFNAAEKVLIGPIFQARDQENFGVSSQSIVDISSHKNISAAENLETILAHVSQLTDDYIIIVMGAGESYKWAKEILTTLKK